MTKNKLTEYIQSHANDDVNELLLHAEHHQHIDIQEAVCQIRGLQIASRKLPLWAQTEDIRFPIHLSMEQCSSETTANYKAMIAKRILKADNIHMADLTGGFGVDATILAKGFKNCQLTFIEQDADLCDLARHNLPLLGVNNLDVICAKSEEILPTLPYQHLIMIDPARRDIHGRKMAAIDDCTPNVLELNDLLLEKAEHLFIKLSPMLDIHAACQKLRGIREVHVVSVDGECKELLLIASKEGDNNVHVHCVNIRKDGVELFKTDNLETNEKLCIYTNKVGAYLFEPNASIMKAGLFNALANRFAIQKLHPNSHLFTADRPTNGFPGRQFKVTAQFGFSKNDIKTLQQTIKQANITVRNFPSTPEQLYKRLKIKQGGNNFIFVTTTNDNRHLLILCEKMPDTTTTHSAMT